ncbi:MAG: hypothetical protein R3B72_15975 [Polyangiaceae bacterium]
MTREVLLLAGLAALSGCALVLGFEEHEPFPEGGGGAGASGTGGGSSSGGAGPSAGGGGAGGEGAGGVDVLLIPDPSTDSVGMYSPVDGTYLGDFIPPITGTEPYTFQTPHEAIQGPDGRIYVSDQLTDSIVRFEPDGSFESIFADATDGLDNVRGMDFRNDILFASHSPIAGTKAIVTFNLSGTRLADFIPDIDAFDIFFTPANTALVANIEDPDDIRLYDVDGTNYQSLLSIDFPQQIQPLPDGDFVVAAWTDVVQFTIAGTVVRSITGLSSCSGVYPLEDGQWLISSDDGVQSINPFSMQVVDTKRVGSSYLKIEKVNLPALP